MRYRDLVEDYKIRGENIRKMKDELAEEVKNYRALESYSQSCNPTSIDKLNTDYHQARKSILGDRLKPTDEDLVRLKELSDKHKEDLKNLNAELGIAVVGSKKTEFNQKKCQAARKIRQLERKIYTEGRKNMHLHIALSFFRGTPLNKILSPGTRKKIREASVFEFLENITEY